MEDSTETQQTSTIVDANDMEPRISKALSPLSLIDEKRLGLYILTQRDRPIASLESMKEFLDLPDDVATKLRVEETHEQFEEDLDRLYAQQSEEYMDDAEDRYYALDEDKTPYPQDIESIYARFRYEDCNPQLEWDYALAYTKSTYETRLRQLEAPAATDFEFPKSIDEYRQKPKDTQLRTARFLMLETDEQREKMLTEFGWAWRQVKPLKDAFQADTEFQEELRASMTDLTVGDPRKR